MEEPWIIRHRGALLAGMIFCALLPVAFFIAVLQSPNISPANFGLFGFAFISSIMAALVLYMLYGPATRYAEILAALDFDLADVQLKRSILKCTTLSGGEFSLFYSSGRQHQNPYYKLWITTLKQAPVPLGGQGIERWKLFLAAPWSVSFNKNSVVLWREPMFRWASKIANIDLPDAGFPNTGLPDNVSNLQLNGIKSLREIKIETLKGKNRIVAILNDKWFYSETHDILSTLNILWKIDEGL